MSASQDQIDDPKRSPRVDACVVTYNSEETIDRLLASLVAEPLVSSIRVLDNASIDGTLERLREWTRRETLISLVPSERNLGFPAGCNVLLRACEAELVLLVNPDVELRPGVLSRLCDVASADRALGAVTCQLRTRDGRPQSEPARPVPTLRRLLAANAPATVRRLRPSRAQRQEALDETKDVGAAMGALLLLRRSVLDEVGLLDETVFMYLEDLDLSARLRRDGYRIRYQGDVWAWHDSGVSSAPNSTALYALMPQVWLTYFHRYGSATQRRLVRPALVLICLSGILAEAFGHGRPGKHRAALSQALRYRPRMEPSW